MTGNKALTLPDLSAYKGIVWDMDGTLIDSMGAHMQAWKQTCEVFGYPFDLEYMHGLGGVPTRQTVVILNEKHEMTHSPDEVAETKRKFWLSMGESPTIIEHTFLVVKHYQDVLKMGIGTGAERDHALNMLEETDMMQYFSTLVTASDVTHGKPHPETFLTVAQNLGLSPSDCVVFEDTEIGRKAAIDAGMDCIMVHQGQIQFT